MNSTQLKLGISRCLLGDKVRYDGGHKLDPYLVRTLGPYVTYVPVCPEVECGMPVQREPLRLVGDVGDAAVPRLVGLESDLDHTATMQVWAKRRLDELEAEGLCGFIFKSKSPSCGLERVKVYDAHGVPRPVGVGIWARLFMQRFPLLAFQDKARLHDAALLEDALKRLSMHKELQDFYDAWTHDPHKTRSAFTTLTTELVELSVEAKGGIELSFVPRPGATYSLRGRHTAPGARPVFVLVDVVDDASGRWLSVCFYADAVSDPEELGNLVPKGLLGDDGYCFDLENPSPGTLDYLLDRIREGARSVVGLDAFLIAAGE